MSDPQILTATSWNMYQTPHLSHHLLSAFIWVIFINWRNNIYIVIYCLYWVQLFTDTLVEYKYQYTYYVLLKYIFQTIIVGFLTCYSSLFHRIIIYSISLYSWDFKLNSKKHFQFTNSLVEEILYIYANPMSL